MTLRYTQLYLVNKDIPPPPHLTLGIQKGGMENVFHPFAHWTFGLLS